MSKLFESLCKLTGNDLAQSADKGVVAGDVEGFVDTGSYSLNILISGRAYGGYPIGRVTGLAGDPAAGKSFACLTAAKEFLESNENSAVFYFESEGAVTKDTIESFGIDTKRFYVVPVSTVQEFRTCAVKILDGYIESGKDRPPMLFILDSLGMLSTTKEMEDTAAGSETKDMTRNQIIKATFRVLTLKMAMAKVAMIATTHTYASMDMYSPKEVSGGSGLKFAASTIVMLNKRKEKDGKDIIGNNIRAVAMKSRMTKEFSQIETIINYQKGLDKYYGLLDIAEQLGIFKKDGTRYLVGDKKVFGSVIEKNPEQYFTKEVMDEIDRRACEIFCYGAGSAEEISEGGQDQQDLDTEEA